MSIFRCKFTKEQEMIYISHLDLLRLFDKAIRRAKIRIAFSSGFNPHPKMSFGHALSLGMKSIGEYIDIELEEDMDKDEFLNRINKELPLGIKFLDVIYIQKSTPSLISSITHAEYETNLKLKEKLDINDINNRVAKFLNTDEIIDLKKNKKGKINEINIRPLIKKLKIYDLKNDILSLNFMLVNSASSNLKATTLISKLNDICKLNIDEDYFDVKRIDFYIEEDNILKRPI